jgi:hypothetical protein
MMSRMVSDEVCESIVTYCRQHMSTMTDNGSVYFPKRRVLKELPPPIMEAIQSSFEFAFDVDNIRIYHSNYGTVKPHRDVPTNPKFTYTCLIYLTDDFYGGRLTVQQKEEDEYAAFEPIVGYGVVFSKDRVHFTDEQLGGDKMIMIIDVTPLSI